jgi:hypothetical protein
MGLRNRIQAAQRRKAIRASFERAEGRTVLALKLAEAKDGGILIHAAIERNAEAGA